MFNIYKGWLGEKMTQFGTWMMLDEDTYHRFHNVIVPGSDGTTQIDHVFVSIFGIFVIETKNMSGWIFGSAEQARWTQVIYGKKTHFQNPLRQNYRHTRCLADYLQIDHQLIRPIVFFIGECEFKTEMPPNVLTSGLCSYIESFEEPILTPMHIAEIEYKLQALKDDPDLTKSAHLDSLRARHESITKCPKCGGSLVKRVTKRGEHAGREFLGCSNFPRCHYIRVSS
jgi:hypothetical protein